jgi:hypothetical protein
MTRIESLAISKVPCVNKDRSEALFVAAPPRVFSLIFYFSSEGSHQRSTLPSDLKFVSDTLLIIS